MDFAQEFSIFNVRIFTLIYMININHQHVWYHRVFDSTPGQKFNTQNDTLTKLNENKVMILFGTSVIIACNTHDRKNDKRIK